MSKPHHIAMDDGCRIACDYQPRAGAPVLVLSPSLGTSMALFDAQVAALSDRYSILRYDPRGHGGSDVPEGSYSLDRLGRDVLGLIDALEIERAHFAGVSLGGMTGQWLGYRAPERLLSLTLANTSAYMGPPSGWADRIAAVLDKGMEAMVAPVLERWFTAGFRAACPTDVSRVAAMLLSTAPLIAVPSLVIAGNQDPATPPEHAEFLVSAIPDARLVSLEAAHLSNVEQAALFNRTLRDFLERR
ncbi:MAG: alpha/beta fold hydrolase [Novosphingobium sp.]|nr:alpha/beta fold hydrolase [Novosphingobium sp.]